MKLEHQHLIGRKFVYGGTDCLDLLRSFYKHNFALETPNFARPEKFWEHGMDLYREKIWQCGFRPVDCHPQFYLPGDLILMVLGSKIANHAGVLVEDSYILHHVYGNLSCTEPYSGKWRDRTVGVYRHPECRYEPEQTKLDLRSLLSPSQRSRIEAGRRV